LPRKRGGGKIFRGRGQLKEEGKSLPTKTSHGSKNFYKGAGTRRGIEGRQSGAGPGRGRVLSLSLAPYTPCSTSRKKSIGEERTESKRRAWALNP